MLEFDHTNILFGLVVGERDANVMKESEDGGLVAFEAVEEVLGFGLFAAAAFVWVGRGAGWGMGGAALGDDGVKVLEERGFFFGSQLRAAGSFLLGDGAHFEKQENEIAGPGLMEFFVEERKFAHDVDVAEGVGAAIAEVG